MSNATLAQGNQVLNLILQSRVSSSKLQDIMESGLLSDLLNSHIFALKCLDREAFQVMLGFPPWGQVGLHSPEIYKECEFKEEGCTNDRINHYATGGTTKKEGVPIKERHCCNNKACQDKAMQVARKDAGQTVG